MMAILGAFVLCLASHSVLSAGIGELKGPLCLFCHNAENPNDCQKVLQCSEHESCYTERFINEENHEFMRLGCKAAPVCEILEKFQKEHGMTGTNCLNCCKGDYCNQRLCSNETLDRVQCYSCSNVLSPHECSDVKTCDYDEVCSTEEIITDQTEIRYNVGCKPKQTCLLLGEPSETNPIGKRQDKLCDTCCTSSFCNREMCGATEVTYTVATRQSTSPATASTAASTKASTSAPTTPQPSTKPTTPQPSTKPSTAKPKIRTTSPKPTTAEPKTSTATPKATTSTPTIPTRTTKPTTAKPAAQKTKATTKPSTPEPTTTKPKATKPSTTINTNTPPTTKRGTTSTRKLSSTKASITTKRSNPVSTADSENLTSCYNCILFNAAATNCTTKTTCGTDEQCFVGLDTVGKSHSFCLSPSECTTMSNDVSRGRLYYHDGIRIRQGRCCAEDLCNKRL